MNWKIKSSVSGRIVYVILFFLIGGLVGYAVGSSYEYTKNTKKGTSELSAITNKPVISTAVPTQTTSSTLSNLIVISTASNNSVVNYYFDTSKNTLIEKKEIYKGEDTPGGESVYDNSQAQFAQGGPVYIHLSQLGGMGGNTPVYSKIYRYPDNKVILAKNDNEYFERWVINKDGSRLYAAIPTSPESDASRKYNLVSVDTTTLNSANVASLGHITSPLFLNNNETKILSAVAKDRVESGYTYHDYYTVTVDLSTKSVNEALIWRDRQPGPVNFWSIETLAFGPKLIKAVGDYKVGSDQKTTVRTVNLSDQKEQDIYELKGNGQIGLAQWSPDGMKVLFSPRSYGESIPTDQGVVMYDFNNGKSSQLVQASASSATDGVIVNETRLVRDSFNGASFAYSIQTGTSINQNDLYFYNGNSGKSYLVAKNISRILSAHIY